MPQAVWQQLPTECAYETQHAGAYVAVIETMFDTYSRLVVTDGREADDAETLEVARTVAENPGLETRPDKP